MRQFEYSPRLPGQTICAPGAVDRLPGLLPAGTKRVLLVSDQGLARLGVPQRVAADLESVGFQVSLFAQIAGEPTLADLEACRDQAEQSGATAVIGLGGGSAMDTAKAVAALATSGQTLASTLGSDLLAGRPLGLVLIPTTAGTGAEATPNALFIDTQRLRKVALISGHLLPDTALLDPTLTIGLPPVVTASTGLDALTHAVESFISKRANPISRSFAAEAVTLIAGSLDRAVIDGHSIEARTSMLVASYLGGAALTIAGTGAVHALAYSLGSRGVPHGVANGLLVPYVMRYNEPECRPELDRLSTLVGADFLTWLDQLVSRMPIAHRLGELNIPASEFPAMAQESMEHTRLLANNPREWTPEAALAILNQVE